MDPILQQLMALMGVRNTLPTQQLPQTPQQLAALQLQQHGITNEQRQGYFPVLSKAISSAIPPSGYFDVNAEEVGRALKSIVLPEKVSPRYEGTGRQDAWRMYLGLPQENNTFRVSTFSPSISKEKDKVYFSINDFEKGLYRFEHFLRGKEQKALMEDFGADLPAFMGNFTVSKGQDERGHYLAYYDIWDLGQKSAQYALKAGLGKPFEIYGRVYYDPKTFKAIPEDKLPKPKPIDSKKVIESKEKLKKIFGSIAEFR